jgi:glucose/arabinose dehydrogenase
MIARSIEKRIMSLLCGLLSLMHTFAASSAIAQSEFEPGLRFVEDSVLKGLPISTAIAFAPNNKVYLAQKTGSVRVVDNGTLLTAPFIDLSGIVNKSTDRGLLGLAVDPQFPTKPFIYLSYVYDPPGVTPDSAEPRVIRVVRYRADSTQNYNVADATSEEVLVGRASNPENMAPPVPLNDPNIPERASCMTGRTMDGEPIEDCVPCDALSHTAGTLIFGTNRELYVSFGDGADYNGPTRVAFRAQNLDSLSGRVLRINPDSGDGLPGNPYYDADRPRANRSRVWAYGFRNPFRITRNPVNGEIYVGDVGTSYFEEINAGKGANFGWPCYEGGFSVRATVEGAPDTSLRQVGYRVHPRTVDFCNQLYAQGQSVVTKPAFAYRHPYDATGKDLGASITGLAFYQGRGYSTEFDGALFFADYAQRFIKYLTFDADGNPTVHNFAKETGSKLGAVQLTIGPDSNLYAVYIDLTTRTSEVRRFRYVGQANSPPVVRADVTPLSGDIPLTVQCSADRSYDLDGQELAFMWDFGDGTTSTLPNPSHTYTSVGSFAARVTVSEAGNPASSASTSFILRTGVKPPVVEIVAPDTALRYRIGEPVAFEGLLQQSVLPSVQFNWSILQKHNQHEHLVAEVAGSRGSFVPTEHTDDTSYELCFSATMGEGLSDQKCRPVLPLTTTYTLASFPPGATMTYVDDEVEGVAPYLVNPIVGSRQTVNAAALHRGRSFWRWSDGLTDRSRSFVAVERSTTLTALYVNLPPHPLVQFRLSRARAGVNVTLNGIKSSDPEGESLTYRWVFSDRSSSRRVAVKRFVRTGRTLTARLTVRDSLGAEGARTVRVVVTRRGTLQVRGASLLRG